MVGIGVFGGVGVIVGVTVAVGVWVVETEAPCTFFTAWGVGDVTT